jgi:hypothetical protein
VLHTYLLGGFDNVTIVFLLCLICLCFAKMPAPKRADAELIHRVNRRLVLASYTIDRIRHALIVPFTFAIVSGIIWKPFGYNSPGQGTLASFGNYRSDNYDEIIQEMAARRSKRMDWKAPHRSTLYSQSQPSRPSAANPLAEFQNCDCLMLIAVATDMRMRVWL